MNVFRENDPIFDIGVQRKFRSRGNMVLIFFPNDVILKGKQKSKIIYIMPHFQKNWTTSKMLPNLD
jgi:hypothetical protein